MDTATPAKKRGHRSATAFHEAGHAVADFYLRHKIGKVTIIPEGDVKGRATNIGRDYLEGIDVELTPAKKERIFNKIIALATGHFAQKRFNARSVRTWQASSDNEKALRLAWLVSPDSEGAQLLLRWLYHEAEVLVNRRRRDISAVAQALLAKGTLKGEEVRTIILSLYGPMPMLRPAAKLPDS